MCCRNDELSSMLILLFLLKNSELFILLAKSFSNFCYSHSLDFHVSGSPESVSKQPTQLIFELNLSLWHIIVT